MLTTVVCFFLIGCINRYGGIRRGRYVTCERISRPYTSWLTNSFHFYVPLTLGSTHIAKVVVLTLKRIAASGRTVVCTIHQPRADIWHVFDNVVLLVTGGCAAYSGRADKVVEYFEGAGHVAPAFTNIPGRTINTGSFSKVIALNIRC